MMLLGGQSRGASFLAGSSASVLSLTLQSTSLAGFLLKETLSRVSHKERKKGSENL